MAWPAGAHAAHAVPRCAALQMFVMEGDGNCQFRAVSFGLYGEALWGEVTLPKWRSSRSLFTSLGPGGFASKLLHRTLVCNTWQSKDKCAARCCTARCTAGSQDYHAYVRQQAVEHMRRRHKDFEAFLGQPCAFCAGGKEPCAVGAKPAVRCLCPLLRCCRCRAGRGHLSA